MKSLMNNMLSLPLALRLLVLANAGALAFALTMQYGFAFEPCNLCLWQRVPYALAAVLSVLALIWKPYMRQTTVLLALCSLLYVTGAGIAFFHSGVERHWWAGTEGCEAAPLQGASFEELRQALLQTISPRCDEIQGMFLGLSMTNWNVLAFLGLAFFACVAAVRHARVKNLPFLFCCNGKNFH